MIIGVPTEIKPDESRVSLTPAGAAVFRRHGHSVLVQSGAGTRSNFPDRDYRAAGAIVVKSAHSLWERAEMVLKVKEPQPGEYPLLRKDLILFTFLHLAANPRLAKELLRRGTTAVAYETIQLHDGGLPLLAPMSEIAGRLAIQIGAWCLQRRNGGRGVLLSGAAGVRPGRVVVVGGGIAGANASTIAVGIGAGVTIMDVNPRTLRRLSDRFGGRVTTIISSEATLDEEITRADLVIGAALVPGARAPRLIRARTVRRMRPGAVIVDIAIDQGGVCETSRPTTHGNPAFIRDGVVHSCVTNMPAMVPRTSTFALTNATLPYALEIADRGLIDAARTRPEIRLGLNVQGGAVTHPAVARALRMRAHPPRD